MAGLVLARRGVRALVIDPKPGPTRESRAIVVQPRSMEIFDQLGLADAVLDSAQLTLQLQIRGGHSPVGADFFAQQPGLTPLPGVQILEQSHTESLLGTALAAVSSRVLLRHRT